MNKERKLFSTFMSFFVFALFPIVSMAVGLGDVRVLSHLNEPLLAEIELKSVNGIDLSELIAQSADTSEYTKAGLDIPPWLQQIRYEITRNKHSGKEVLKLTTQQPVKDPFVNLLIVVTWPAGKIIKEYTLLLDPPKAAIVPVKAKQIATSSTSVKKVIPNQKVAKSTLAPGKVARVVKQRADERRLARAQSRVVRPGGIYRPEYDETLWSVAKRLVENTPYTVHQGVMAIANKNPQAFNGNINAMQQGAVLELPDRQELCQFSPQQAQHLVEQEIQEWQRGSIHVAQRSSSSYSTSSHKPLKLVAPINDDIAPKKKPKSRDSSSYQDTSIDESQPVVSERISLIEEAIDTLKRSNEDILQKNKHLQTQNESLQTLLVSKDEEINKLKEVVKKNQLLPQMPDQAVEHHASNKSDEPSSVNEQKYAVAVPDLPIKTKNEDFYPPPKLADFQGGQLPELKSTASQAEAPSSIKTKVTATQSSKDLKVAEPNKTVGQTQIESSDVQYNPKSSDAIKRDILFIILLFVIMSTTLGWVWFSRNRFQTIFETFSSNMRNLKAFNFRKAKSGFTESSGDDVQANYGLNFDLDKALSAVSLEDNKFSKVKVPAPAEAQTSTHQQVYAQLEEAEVYIAYERYSQAEQVLQEILSHHPNHWEALLKLLELYVLTEKYQEFEQWYATIPENLKDLAPKIWSRILVLQEKVKNEKSISVTPKEEIIEELDENASHHIPLLEDIDMDVKRPSDEVEKSPSIRSEGEKKDNKSKAAHLKDLVTPKTDEFFDLKKSYDLSLEEEQNSSIAISPSILPSTSSNPGLLIDTPSQDKKSIFKLEDKDSSGLKDSPKASIQHSGIVQRKENTEHNINDLSAMEKQKFSNDAQSKERNPQGDLENQMSFDKTASAIDSPKEKEKLPPVDYDNQMIFDRTPSAVSGSQPMSTSSAQNELQDAQSHISLAQAYLEIGDIEAARELLIKALTSGDSEQKQQAQFLLNHLDKK